MTYGVRILPTADTDVDDLAIFIAQDSVDVALRFYDAVEKTFLQIAENPEVYAIYPLDHPRLEGLRKCAVIGFPNHLIFYRIEGDMVEIIRLLHGARDVPEALTGEFPDQPMN